MQIQQLMNNNCRKSSVDDELRGEILCGIARVQLQFSLTFESKQVSTLEATYLDDICKRTFALFFSCLKTDVCFLEYKELYTLTYGSI